MTSFHLSEHAWLAGLQAGTWIGAGALIGALYFLALRLERHDACLWPRTAVRDGVAIWDDLLLLAGILAVIASRFGALPLLLAAAGIVAARMAAVRLGALT